MLNKQTGFSLLEILVAFTILAVSLSILLKIFSSGVQTAVVAEKYTIATQIAESLIGQVGTDKPLEEGMISGVEDEEYHWQIHVYKSVEPLIEAVELNDLMAVNVVVEWGEGEYRRSVELNTLRAFHE